ncbi:hypothetical protein BU15DRAFT_83209 [Melanogaster broomeanus]|nr:hypothetical protein BU15DRAFT_83209 [Melanogaster broomeanus]
MVRTPQTHLPAVSALFAPPSTLRKTATSHFGTVRTTTRFLSIPTSSCKGLPICYPSFITSQGGLASDHCLDQGRPEHQHTGQYSDPGATATSVNPYRSSRDWQQLCSRRSEGQVFQLRRDPYPPQHKRLTLRACEPITAKLALKPHLSRRWSASWTLYANIHDTMPGVLIRIHSKHHLQAWAPVIVPLPLSSLSTLAPDSTTPPKYEYNEETTTQRTPPELMGELGHAHNNIYVDPSTQNFQTPSIALPFSTVETLDTEFSTNEQRTTKCRRMSTDSVSEPPSSTVSFLSYADSYSGHSSAAPHSHMDFTTC